MISSGFSRFGGALSLILVLAACQSSEERAAEHYQNALALIEAGDPARAIVEFRNVFRLDGDNREARLDYAAVLRRQNNIEGAYAQYLRVAEQFPEDIAALTALSRIAVELQSWDEARRHGRRLLELEPDTPEAEVIAVSLDYADALVAEDASARRDVARRADALRAERPDDMLLMRLGIDARILESDMEGALALLDEAMAIAPEDRLLYNTRLALLAELDREDEIEAQLLEMRKLFPEDGDVDQALLSFYLSQGEPDRAEAFLRDIAADADGEAGIDATADVVRFVLQSRGADAALAELDASLEGPDPSPRLQALRAGILYDAGSRSEAVAEMEGIVARIEATVDDAEGATASEAEEATAGPQTLGEQANLIKVALAQMLIQEGNPVGARRLVEEILAADATQVDALRIKAAWLIEEDEADEAIALLRTALDQRPGDSQALSLTAMAHARNGNGDLSREFLSLAVEASGNAPAESLRYASALLEQDRYLPAEEVVTRALRASRGNLDLLGLLGQIYVRMEDWPRTVQVETQIRGLAEGLEPEAPVRVRATNLANALQARRLGAQGRVDDAISFLETLAQSDEGAAIDAQMAVVRARLANGEGDAAVDYAQTALAETPDSPALAFVLAAAQAATGRYDEAEAGYRALIERGIGGEPLWINLIRVLNAKGDPDGARAALADGLEALPDGMDLLWAQASFMEQAGDVDGAIGVYEQLRERAPNSDLIANNLASLLVTSRDDPETLDRAERMVRRLRGSDVPAFQDTYGWIAYRRGDLDQALEHLEPAAAQLTGDPMVQYHLGMTYAALDRTAEALEVLRRADTLAGEGATGPYLETLRAEIARLDAGLAESPAAQTEGAAGTDP